MLNNEWSTCTRCNLGAYRDSTGAHIIAGEGELGGIMFIGHAPSKEDNEIGRPFYNDLSQAIREMVRGRGIPAYYTNLVICRSCEQASGNGELLWNTDKRTGAKRPYIVDRMPTTSQQLACQQRLHEEIYIVDPLLIVALGAEAARALSPGGRFGGMLNEHGRAREIQIPGAGKTSSLTEKKHDWFRKVRGEYVMPTDTNMVRYLMFPTYHPSDLLRHAKDLRKGNVNETFEEDLREIARVYDAYSKHVNPNAPSYAPPTQGEEPWPQP